MRPYLTTLAIAALALFAACNKEAPAPGDSSGTVVESSPSGAPDVVQLDAAAPGMTVANSYNWEGDPPTIESLKGKVVVLDFWAYW